MSAEEQGPLSHLNEKGEANMVDVSGKAPTKRTARALANHPELVLADEPTGNLDRERSQEAIALIREVCRENEAALLLVWDAVEQRVRLCVPRQRATVWRSPGPMAPKRVGLSWTAYLSVGRCTALVPPI